MTLEKTSFLMTFQGLRPALRRPNRDNFVLPGLGFLVTTAESNAPPRPGGRDSARGLQIFKKGFLWREKKDYFFLFA